MMLIPGQQTLCQIQNADKHDPTKYIMIYLQKIVLMKLPMIAVIWDD